MHPEISGLKEEANPNDHAEAATEDPEETDTAMQVTETITPATTSSTPLVSFDDKTETNEQEEEEKPVKFGKIADPHVLGCCEFCGGPVKRRRFCSPLKRFCSKGCSRSSRKAKVCMHFFSGLKLWLQCSSCFLCGFTPKWCLISCELLHLTYHA